MKSKEVHSILEELYGKTTGIKIIIRNEPFKFLREKKLISTMPAKEYEWLAEDVSRIPALRIEIENNYKKIQSYSDNIHLLERELNSNSHKLLAGIRAKFGKADELAEKLDKTKNEYKELCHDEDLINADMKILQEKKDKIKDFIKTNQCYVKPTQLGRKQFDHLDARIERLEDVCFDAFEKEYKNRWRLIEERYGKYLRIKDELIKKYSFYESKQLDMCALTVSGLEGKVENISMEGGNLHVFLKRINYDYRWKIVAELLTHKNNDPDNLKKNFENMYEIMIENNEKKDYSTEETAARIMKHGDGLDEAGMYFLYFVFNGLKKRLKKAYNGYFDNESQDDFLASHLMEHNKDDLNSKPTITTFIDYNKLLIKTGRRTGFKTKIAALILMDEKNKLIKDKVDSLDKTVHEMTKIGWGVCEAFYPAAAAISLMPGTVKENVQMVDEVVVDLLKGVRYGLDSTNKAVALMNGGYVFESYLNF